MRNLCSMPLWVVVLALGCNSDKSTSPQPSAEFPLAVGSHWVYYAYDSTGTWADTADVLITEEVTDLRGTGSIVSTTYRGGGDSAGTAFYAGPKPLIAPGQWLVIQRGDSVLYFSANPDFDPYMFLILPFEEGAGWNNPAQGWRDTTYFDGIDTTLTPAGEFRGTQRITESIAGLDCAWRYHHWFVPEIGFVKSRKQGHAYLCGDESIVIWELLSYDIPSPGAPDA